MWHLLSLIGAFAVGFAAEFASEVWHIEYLNAVGGKYRGVREEVFSAKVWRARKWGMLLFGLATVDIASVLGGLALFSAVIGGAACGAFFGIAYAMRKKYTRLNGPRVATEEDEEDD